MKKTIFLTQGVIQIFVGFSAFVSGALMIIFPSGEIFQASPEMLRGSPFHDFLLPGVILMVVNGVGQLVAGILSFRKHWFAGYAGAVFGLGLIIWIFVQVNMIGGRHIIQYSYFGLGVLETALSFLIQGWLSTKKQAVQPDIALHI